MDYSEGKEYSVPIDKQPLSEWQDCPGCPKCEPNGGYVLRKGNWRPTTDYEYIYQLAKSVPYYSDREAVKTGYAPSSIKRADGSLVTTSCPERQVGFKRKLGTGANLRSVWQFSTQSCGYQHYAAFPLELPLRCIQAGTSEFGVCAECGAPYARVIKPSEAYAKYLGKSYTKHEDDIGKGLSDHPEGFKSVNSEYQTLGWRKTCECDKDQVVPATVLDPFAGTGTTLEAAGKSGRRSLGY